MKYRVYCGFLDFLISVDANSEEMAIVKGKQEALERMEDADFWARPFHETPDLNSGGTHD